MKILLTSLLLFLLVACSTNQEDSNSNYQDAEISKAMVGEDDGDIIDVISVGITINTEFYFLIDPPTGDEGGGSNSGEDGGTGDDGAIYTSFTILNYSPFQLVEASFTIEPNSSHTIYIRTDQLPLDQSVTVSIVENEHHNDGQKLLEINDLVITFLN